MVNALYQQYATEKHHDQDRYSWSGMAGGTYQSYYKEQSLNNIAIDRDHLQPLKFQGHFYDNETGLHYNI